MLQISECIYIADSVNVVVRMYYNDIVINTFGFLEHDVAPGILKFQCNLGNSVLRHALAIPMCLYHVFNANIVLNKSVL